METSYTVDFEAEQVRGLIRELTQTDEYGRAGSTPPSLLAVHPCAEYRKPPVRANRGSLFLPAAGGFRPQLGSMEFGF